MEIITEITQTHYVVFVILAIISTGIVSAIVFKKIQKYKRYQFHKNHALNMDVDKIENAFKDILRHIDNYQNDDPRNRDMIVMGISGIVNHQLGHIPRMRSWLE